MRLTILVGVVAGALWATPAAHACLSLPAPSAKDVPVSVVEVDRETERTALRVCAGGRPVQLARGTMRAQRRGATGVRIGAASAAGRRVAWIEERRRGVARTVTVTVAAVGREVRVVRRFTVLRQRTSRGAELDVLLTREGDLAWSAGTTDEPGSGVVAIKQPGKPVRRLADHVGTRLTLDGKRTLRWWETEFRLAFFDLRPVDCRTRPGSQPLAGNDEVLLTRTVYGHETDGVTVIRGCDPRTRRDRELLQNDSEFGSESTVYFVGLDREWAVFWQSVLERDGAGPATVTVVNARTGRGSSASPRDADAPDFLGPLPGTPFAVTTGGTLGWVQAGVLYALPRSDRVIRLDTGTIADLRADGGALTWTRDGAPQRVVPAVR